MYVIELIDRAVRRIALTQGNDELRPRWSADGKRVVCGVDAGLEILEINSGRAFIICGSDGGRLTAPQTGDWRRDGSRIVYNKDRLWTIDPSGRNDRALPVDGIVAEQ